MTKKDYIAVANILKSFKKQQTKSNPSRRFELSILIEDFCDYFKSDNPNFSKEKFKNAVMGQ